MTADHGPRATGDPHQRRELRIVRWANDLGMNGEQLLGVALGARPASVAQSNATGEGLVSNGLLGADVIRLAAGDGFVPHTHPGDHLLLVLAGQGTITYGGTVYPTKAGEIYMVEGQVPHAVGAITDHVILAVGSPHRPVDAGDRMALVDYEAIAADLGDLHCLICDTRARYPSRLHGQGCPHCPCRECNPF